MSALLAHLSLAPLPVEVTFSRIMCSDVGVEACFNFLLNEKGAFESDICWHYTGHDTSNGWPAPGPCKLSMKLYPQLSMNLAV